MFIVLLIASLLPASLGCLSKSIPPCSCDSEEFITIINCKAATDVDQLEKSLLQIQNTSVQILLILNSTLLYLPSDVFKGFEIQMIIINSSTFQDLTESEVAFEGLENSLQYLFIRDCTIFNGLNWNEFRDLKRLKNLQFLKTGLTTIDSDIGDIAHLPLNELQLTQASTSYIDDNAFAKFKSLMTLSLRSNHISKLKRSMFPTGLYSIDLSYNSIDSLPEDIFTNMPRLREVLLASNYLITVDQKTFSPVWSQLWHIDLFENPIRCDCRMKWILITKSPMEIKAECVNPPNLAGSTFKSLKAGDLKC